MHRLLHSPVAFAFVAAGLWLVVSFANATNPRAVPVELSEAQQGQLAQLTCYGSIESFRVVRHLDAPFGDYASVQCPPHSSYQGHAVARFVRCARPKVDTVWTCDAAIPTVLVNVNDRDLLIRYPSSTVQDALDVVAYVFSKPIGGKFGLDSSERADSTVFVSQTGNNFHVSTGTYAFSLTRESSLEGPRFRLQSVLTCQGDTCHPVASPSASRGGRS